MATKEQRINLYNKLVNFLYEIDHNVAAEDHCNSAKEEFVRAGYKFLHKVENII